MKSDILQLISDNRLFEAMQQMKEQKMKPRERKSLAVVESRLSAINEKIRLGILSSENADLELNKIRTAVFDINESIFKPEEEGYQRKQYIRYGLIAAGVVVLGVLSFILFGPETCKDHKVGVLVANFQNVDRGKEIDAFASKLASDLRVALPPSTYEVTPVGYQTREQSRYDAFITEEYYQGSCDTSGLFVNGFLDKEEKVFNVYLTIVQLELNLPERFQETSITLSNPNGIEFNIPDDTKYLADFIVSILDLYDGNTVAALKGLLAFEDKSEKGVILGSKDFTAAVAYYTASCFAANDKPEKAVEYYSKAYHLGGGNIKYHAEENYQSIQKTYPKQIDQDRAIEKTSTGDPDLDLALKILEVAPKSGQTGILPNAGRLIDELIK